VKHGASWYQREPLAYLGGVQGMPMRLHAVYGVVIDLCYAHGGAINNDPKWISGWFSDMGSAAVRKAIAELIELGKLTVDEDGSLTQKRAKNEAKTREKLRETAVETGRKGGINSGKARAAAREINGIAEGSASSKTKQIRLDKITEEDREAKASLERSRFSEFWDAYPHRDGKRNRAGAAKSYERAVKRGVPQQTIIDGAKRAIGDRRVRDGFARDPTTWLNQEGWADEIDPNAPPSLSRGSNRGERLDDLAEQLKARLTFQRFA
jgi:hypothetical protein